MGAMRSTLSMPFCKVMTRVFGPTIGRRQFCRLLRVPQLDREQHDIDRADRLRIVGRVDLGQMQVAVDALDFEAVLFDRIEIGAAGDEKDLVPRGRHACGEISADCARCHRRYTHRLTPSKGGRGIACDGAGGQARPRDLRGLLLLFHQFS